MQTDIERPRIDAIGPQLQYVVEQFLYREAELLDGHQFHEWLDLMTEDVVYQMPVRANRMQREADQQFAQDGESFYFDETKRSLRFRVAKRDTGTSWSENPMSRTRHLVSNVRLAAGDRSGDLKVRSAYIVYRTRLERHVDIFAGERQDVLRQGEDGGLRIARRLVVLDQATLLAPNLSIFF